MQTISTHSYKTPYGELLLGSFNEQLCLCDWTYRKMRSTIDKRIQTGLDATYVDRPCDLLEVARRQLDEYFQQKRRQFDLPLKMIGTNFQQSVWHALLNIPYGSTSSYLELANTLNKKLAVRAVASANGANAMSIIIPCHRVIGSNGELTGYAGGLPTKKRLLQLERHE
ncbi:MAG: cysteine methyltransferase [Piscirickettsiaceae bacterium]|nr:MAG: cysteine methyltransferase [Piscirickettsiaceae bacterium]